MDTRKIWFWFLNTLDRRLPLAWKRSDKTDFKLSGNFEVIPEHGLILSCNKSWISWFWFMEFLARLARPGGEVSLLIQKKNANPNSQDCIFWVSGNLWISEFHHISNRFLLNISQKSQKFPGLFKFYPVVKKILSRMLFNVRAILNLGPFIALAERT